MKAEFVTTKIEELGQLTAVMQEVSLFTVSDGLGIVLTNAGGHSFPFAIHVMEERPSTLSEFVNSIHSEVMTNPTAVPAELRKEVLQILNIVEGKLLENDVPMQSAEEQQSKIYYNLVTGDQLITDIKTINWEENAQHMQNMIMSLNNCKMIVNALLRNQQITAKNEDGEDVQVSPYDHAASEIKAFHENNKMTINYSCFDLPDVTEREKLIAQMIDVMTVYYELLIHTAIFTTQRDVVNYYETMLKGTRETYEKMLADLRGETQEVQEETTEETPAEEPVVEEPVTEEPVEEAAEPTEEAQEDGSEEDN